MRELLFVGAGGFIGAICRYLLGGFVQRVLHEPRFPYGTLAVNLLGCLAIGFLAGLAETRQVMTSEMRLFLLIGVLGGFTTFSSFGYETISLLRDGQMLSASVNVLTQVGLGLAGVWIGLVFSRMI